MNSNFDEAAIMRDLLLVAAAGEYQALPETAPQVTSAYRKRFAKMQADPFGYAAGLAKPWRRRLRRAALAAALLLAIIGGTIFAIPQTRTIAVNMLTKFYQDHIEIRFDNDAAIALPDIKINYVPAGYELTYESDRDDEINRTWEYQDENGHMLNVDVFVTCHNFTYSIDSEHGKLEYIKMSSGVEGQLLRAYTEDWPSYLLWNSPDGQLFFSVAGNLSEQELLNIADGIVLD